MRVAVREALGLEKHLLTWTSRRVYQFRFDWRKLARNLKELALREEACLV